MCMRTHCCSVRLYCHNNVCSLVQPLIAAYVCVCVIMLDHNYRDQLVRSLKRVEVQKVQHIHYVRCVH
jgi:hypothetical protein